MAHLIKNSSSVEELLNKLNITVDQSELNELKNLTKFDALIVLWAKQFNMTNQEVDKLIEKIKEFEHHIKESLGELWSKSAQEEGQFSHEQCHSN